MLVELERYTISSLDKAGISIGVSPLATQTKGQYRLNHCPQIEASNMLMKISNEEDDNETIYMFLEGNKIKGERFNYFVAQSIM